MMTTGVSVRPSSLFSFWVTLDKEHWVKRLMILMVCVWMGVVVITPIFQLIYKSLSDSNGRFTGLTNYIYYFSTPSLCESLLNSIHISLITTLISVMLGLVFAYALTRTAIPGKTVFKGLAMVPLFAPTLLNGICLIYLFGRKGLITRGFFGVIPGIDIGLYGPVGIIIAETLYTFPQAVLILSVALNGADKRLYEAAESLGASPLRIFFTVTLPGIKFGLFSAVSVCFILSFVDFGAPKTVGGTFNILATDIYKQVIGQQNFTMGAVVSVILLFPTVIAFITDRLIQRRQVVMVAANSMPLVPKPHPLKDILFFVFCSIIVFAITGFYATALFASLVKVWPYDLTLGGWHYHFTGTGGGGYAALFNSIRMSAYSAIFGTALTFITAYLIEKTHPKNRLGQIAYFLSVLPMALPGLVIGLSYIFFFNAKGWMVAGIYFTNPLNFIYGTMAILVISNSVHFFSVSFLTATTALKHLDRTFETISSSMGVPFTKTFARVTVPLCLPAIFEVGMYTFVNAMTTVSAVIFLYSADIPLASVAVANMDDAGDIAPACAMSILIVAVNIIARAIFSLLICWIRKRSKAIAL